MVSTRTLGLQRPRERSFKLGQPTETQEPQRQSFVVPRHQKGSVEPKGTAQQLKLAGGEGEKRTWNKCLAAAGRGEVPTLHFGSFQRGPSGGAEGLENIQTTSAGIPALHSHQPHSLLAGQRPSGGPLFPHRDDGADQISLPAQKVMHSFIYPFFAPPTYWAKHCPR